MARPYGLTGASSDRFSNAFHDRFERRRVKVTGAEPGIFAQRALGLLALRMGRAVRPVPPRR
jgi:hypothetical protein